MKAGDKIFDKILDQYGVVVNVGENGRYVQYQPYATARPVGSPTIVEVTQIILLIWSIWEPLVSIVEQVRDWLTPDPVRVAARQEARRIRREAKKHLPQ